MIRTEETASGGYRVDVSVVVVNWNTRDMLRECVKSLLPAIESLRVEVIVVDNASRDGSAEMIVNEFPWVRLIRNESNVGFAAANNQGIRDSGGKFVLLLNSDAEIREGALERMWAEAEADDGAGMIGCRVLNSDETLQISCMRFPDFRGLLASALFLPRALPRCRHLGYEDLTWWSHDSDREVEVLKGCVILVRSEAIDEVGGLDEDFWLYGEEVDWCWRMRKAGWRVRFLHEPEVVHHGGASTSLVVGQHLQRLWGAKLQFVRKHRSPFHHALCCGAVALWFGLRIVPELAAAAFGRAGSSDHLRRSMTCLKGLRNLLFRGAASLVSKEEAAADDVMVGV